MKKERFSFRIASDSDREKVFVELMYGGEQFGEITQEGAEPILEIFSPSPAKFWEFPLKEVQEAFEEARRELLEEEIY